MDAITLKPWAWVDLNYGFEIEYSMDEIQSVEIDPNGMLADIQMENNVFPRKEVPGIEKPKSKSKEKGKKKKNKKK